MEKPLVNNIYTLQKFPGKGGWTYVEIPEIPLDSQAAFGMVKVRGNVDDFTFERYSLMPLGNGNLFLPVKAEIRKKIKKQAGDKVTITLYRDLSKLQIPEELEACLKDEPKAYRRFLNLNEGEKKQIIDWIYAAKNVDTKVERIVKTIDQLSTVER
jgi:hypothetical protein